MKKKTAVYEMRRDGWRDYFNLHVSPTANDMRKHIEEIADRDGWAVPTEGWDETRGLVHPVKSIDGPFAHLFLAEDGLGAGIVAHECLHVAMAHERFVLQFGMDYSDQIGEDEERLAYFLTSAIRGVYDTLYRYKHIKSENKGYETILGNRHRARGLALQSGWRAGMKNILEAAEKMVYTADAKERAELCKGIQQRIAEIRAILDKIGKLWEEV